jgi:hypothetical protein
MAPSSVMTTVTRPPAEFEYRVMVVGRGADRGELRQQLTDAAEYGKWELARTRVYVGGARKMWLRRRIIRVARTI